MSPALRQTVEMGLEMTRDCTLAHGLSFPSSKLLSNQDAYWQFRMNQSEEALCWLRGRLGGWQEWFATNWVYGRVDAAFAAALLFRARQELPLALQLANRVVQDLNQNGGLYSTVDSMAAVAMMTELRAAGVGTGNGRVRVDGAECKASEVGDKQVQLVEALDGVAVVELTRLVEEDWTSFQCSVPLLVALERDGRATWNLRAGDSVELVIELESGYEAGDLAWICLPEALTRVVGGGQVKRFAVDFEAQSRLRIPLVVTARGVGRQSFCVCVRNMYSEERAGTPGLLSVELSA